MLAKTIKYTNFNNEDKVLIAHFHLGKADLLRIAANPRFLEEMNEASARQDTVVMLAKIEELVRLSYGIRTEDNDGFRKTKEIQDAFIQSAAYEEFIVDLLTNGPQNFANFIKGVFPPKLMTMLAQHVKEGKAVDPFKDFPDPESDKGTPAEPTYEEQAEVQIARISGKPRYKVENRRPTQEEAEDMNDAELLEAARWYPS